jgi:hypothetical protein
MAVPSVGHTNLYSQDSLDSNTWVHIAKLTNLVFLSVSPHLLIDPPISFSEMLSSLICLETLDLWSIPKPIYDRHMVSHTYFMHNFSNPSSFQVLQASPNSTMWP